MKRFAILILGLLLTSSVLALDAEEFSQDRFKELQTKDALILVDVFATWCPTCAKQHEILQKFQQEHPEIDLHILTVDYDDDRETVRHFRAPRQSTLLLFKGDEQHWFSVAETREEVIFSEIKSAAEFGE
jgi:thioredoxin 1